MRTPPLRRRVTLGGGLVIAVVLLTFDAFVYLSLREGLNGALEDLLAARAEVAVSLALELNIEELADQLAALGVPAAVEAADGRRFVAEPATPRVGQIGPPTAAPHPRVSYTTALPNGGAVEVFASRAGINATLRRLLAVMAIGTLAAVALAYALLRCVTARALAPLDEVVATAERIIAGGRGRAPRARPSPQ
jgi:hypothetical protein